VIDLDTLIREADPARKLVIPPADPSDVHRLSRGPHRSLGRLAGALWGGVAVAVALAVAAIALIAGGHRQGATTRPTPAPSTAGPLSSILGVLRRPQTAADRAALLEPAVASYQAALERYRAAEAIHAVTPKERLILRLRARQLRAARVPDPLARLAAVTPWGEEMILVPYRAGRSEELCMDFAFVGGMGGGGGNCGLTAALIEAGQGWSLEGAGREFAGGSTGVRLFIVVPDGVAKVAFVLSRGSGVAGGPVYRHSLSVLVPVHNNVAFVQVNRQCCDGRVTRWYAADGRLIKVTGNPAASNRVTGPRPSPETPLSRAAERNPSTTNPVHVLPSSGGPSTAFRIQWRVLLSDADYQISATGPNGADCRGARDLNPIVGGGVNDVRGQLYGVTIPGGRGSHGWCPGSYQVSVTLYDLGLAGGLKHRDQPFGSAAFTVTR
jgi:hypothetical protein